MTTVNISERFKLPTDAAEADRLSLQHKMWNLLAGPLYPSALDGTVRQVLDPGDGAQRSVLDLECRTGDWATEMAKEFPHAEVVVYNATVVPNLAQLPNIREIS
jgi:hypothetical protein